MVRVCTQEESSWGVFVPLPDDLVDTIRAEGLDALLEGSELASVYHESLLKYAVERTTFDVD